ncbi:hypothetical protein GPECTOR_206g390 [Gonium pectorale]|uniref:Uncharacterized protein n=1 Tax=Gonium pectorale TaxID=33097 RepID=A0A150FWZ0_GONPE|nr:hypothetical protein GPECTOR_206g390 [Gonium pectorale]|eukprot:KXZ42097.1 hypothetical protein GPECTOR_206g390 [Gonium pectorale]
MTLAQVLSATSFGAVEHCNVHRDCDPGRLDDPMFCSDVPYGQFQGVCDGCWRCCLHPERFNLSALYDTLKPPQPIVGGCFAR